MTDSPQTELDIARLIQSGELPSPQRVGAMWLFNLRITGTGTAYRQKLDQYVYREPDNYLNDEFLARCNGLAIIWEHPESNKLNSEEFAKRSIGAVLLPYLKNDEVWGIGKIYDEDAANAMIAGDLSTSPAVIFSHILENSNILIDDEYNVLIEGIPSIIDHLAICENGVWDKGGDPSGVIVDNPEVNMDKENEVKTDNCAADNDALPGTEGEEKTEISLEEKIKALIKEALEELKAVAVDTAEDDPLGMPDSPMPPIADSEESKEEKKEEAFADAVEVAKLRKQIAELENKLPRHRTDAEYDALAAAQHKAEQHYAAFGDSLAKCRPMDGESVNGYRKRMIKGLQKYSALYGKVDLAKLSDQAMLDIVENGVYADSMTAARAPSASHGGMPHAVVTNEGGRERTEYLGGEPLMVFSPFRQKPRQLVAVRDQTKH